MPTGGLREIGDIALTRYACYLIAHSRNAKDIDTSRFVILLILLVSMHCAVKGGNNEVE